MEIGRDVARSYLPNLVRLFAGIALAPDSEGPLHTKVLAGKEVVSIAGVIPQAIPAAPAPAMPPLVHEDIGDGREGDA